MGEKKEPQISQNKKFIRRLGRLERRTHAKDAKSAKTAKRTLLFFACLANFASLA
jgi:hypothetical protein